MLVGALIHGHHNVWLLALSILISILASLVCLDLIGRIAFSRGRVRLLWSLGGAFALGSGVWAMHYVGTAAMKLPVEVRYHWPTVLLSWLVAVGEVQVTLLILGVLGELVPTRGRLMVASVSSGVGIAAMHYIGIAAMRLPADTHYSPMQVVISVIYAIAISYVGLSVAFRFRDELNLWTPQRFLAALLLGLALPTMDYVGLSAVRFTSRSDVLEHDPDVVLVSMETVLVMALAILMLLCFVAIVSALDRRFHAQRQELATHELQLQAIFDNMVDSIAVLDGELNLVRGNAALFKMIGLQKEFRDPVNKDVPEPFEFRTPGGGVISRDDWPARRALRGDFMLSEKIEVWFRGRKEPIVAECTTSPIRDEKGNVLRVIVCYHDITERQRHFENRARLAAIVDSAQDAIVGSDVNGIVRSWNAAAEKIFGYEAEEMIGESIMRLVPPDRCKEEEQFILRLQRGETIDHVETRRIRKDGKVIDVSLTISPIRDETSRVIGASKTARDITSRKMLERQLFQSQKLESLGQLTGGIAHDFNNLLAVIVGNLSLIERLAKGNDAILKRLHSAQKASARGADLIRRLLTFSSKEQLHPTNLSVNASVQNTIELAGRVLGPEIQIATDLDPTMPVIFADAAGLEAALLNLAVNARDAMPNGGDLTLSTKVRHLEADFPAIKAGGLTPGTYVCLSVADTGTGMSRETLDRVFEPFFTTKPRGKGTGLGLPMVYGFARQSEGTVQVYSELDHGTRVTLYLPVVIEDAHARRPAAAQTRTTISYGSKVLIVDDEPELLEVADAYLSEMGCTTRRAADGRQALELVSSDPDLDLVITDMIMPGGINGVELVKEIRKMIPNIKAIYSSGFSADALAKRDGAPVDGYVLPKPYQRVDFESIVGRALEKAES